MVLAEKAPVAERLLRLRTVDEVQEILASYPKAEWRPLGGRELNYPTVHVGSDPGDALVERVTNADDALIERFLARSGITGLGSPRQAVEALFGFPNGRLLNVRDRRVPAERVQVTLRDSGEAKRPTVVVQDQGIGQHPDDFERTLLSLNESNKRSRLELLGAFGQGGAAVFAFSPYAVFVSRRDPDLRKPGQEDLVGWTIVRLNELDDEDAKYGQYEYLVLPDDRGGLEIPRFPVDELPAEYQDFVGCYFVAIDYQLDRYSDPVFRPKASLWYLLNTVLMDPVYPVLIRDERPKAIRANPKSALEGIVVMGNAVRLSEDKRSTVDYDNTHLINLGDDGTVVVRYWLVKEGEDPKATWERMANYISPEYAVTITLNGQRQGQMRRETFNKLGLMTTGKCLIVQVDCDGLSKRAKRELFSSTRDRIKNSALAERLENEIRAALGLDAQLRALERERKERALRRQSETETKKINELLKKEIAAMRDGDQPVFKKVISTNTEFQLLSDQPLLDETSDDPGRDRPEPFELTEPPAVPTSLHVTSRSIRVPVGGTGVVRLTMDAPDDYVSPEPGLGTGQLGATFTKGASIFHLTGYSAVRRGVLRATISAEKGVPPGEVGRVIFTITRPDDLPLLAEAELNAVDAPQSRAKPAGTRPGLESGPNVHGVTLEGWLQDLGLSDNVVTTMEEDPESGKVTIYVLKEYPPLVSRLKREARDEETMHAYQSKFVAAMGLAAWLQYEDQKNAAEESAPETLEAEIRRAARIFLFSQQIATEKFSE